MNKQTEESLVYCVITDINDPIIDDYIGDTSSYTPAEITLAKSSYIGAIVCRPTTSYSVTSESNLPLAFPIDANIKKYPLHSEAVITAIYFGRLYYWSLNSLGGVNANGLSNLVKSYKSKGNASTNSDSAQAGTPSPTQTRNTNPLAGPEKSGLYGK